MTIKEFARLCGCNTQTLRYYDKIELLKPVKVDPWSGYRYYDAPQAIDFIKIKNLQAADFSIQEIKGLLSQSDAQVYEAFERKIGEQIRKLERIREIQQSYLAEKNTMEQIIYSMTDYILSQCRHPEVLEEFGLAVSDEPQILSRLKAYLNRNVQRSDPGEEVTLTVNDEVIHGQDAVLKRIHSLTQENVKDTIFLNQGRGHTTEENALADPEFPGWDCIWEKKGWARIRDFIDEMPRLEEEYEYVLWAKASAAEQKDLSFPLFFMGAVLEKQGLEDVVINCSSSAANGEENHFKLLRRPAGIRKT